MVLPFPPFPRAAARRSMAAAALALAASAMTAAAMPPGGPGQPGHPPGHAPGHPAPMKHAMGHHGMARLTVQGTGRSSVAPDMATISVGVTTQAPTAAQAMSDNAGKQQAVIDALKAAGIAAEDLQTQGLNLSPVQHYPGENQPPVISGYQAQNIVSARVRDLGNLGPLLDAAVAAGATDVQSVSFSREDSAAAEDEARREAITEARRRAEVMAAAAGMRLGPLVSLSDAPVSTGPSPVMYAQDARAMGAATPVETGRMMLSADVTAVYAMVPADGGPDGEQGGGQDGAQTDAPDASDSPANAAPAPEAGDGAAAEPAAPPAN